MRGASGDDETSQGEIPLPVPYLVAERSLIEPDARPGIFMARAIRNAADGGRAR